VKLHILLFLLINSIIFISGPAIVAKPLLKIVPVLDFKAVIALQNIEIHDSENCRFLSNPIGVYDEPDRLFQYWIANDRPDFYEEIYPDNPSLKEFLYDVTGLTETDPYVLLTNQRSHVNGPDSLNVELVISGSAGSVRKINCLEALLLGVQTERSAAQGHSMYSRPTEFLSYVLKKDNLLKIYYYTVDQPGIGGLGVFNQPLDDDIADGWELVKNIHNHNFFPESKAILGGVVPSAADVQYLRNMVSRFGLNNAVITNGFHSIDLSRDDFKRFSTWEDESEN
jgi:hypothetical protein